jgi:outer membrane immunogenic protein
MRISAFAIVSGTALLFAATSMATAADLPAKAPVYKAPAMVAAAYDWTGFYAGGHVGYGWATDTETTQVGNVAFPAGSTWTVHSDGVLGGAQAGFNYQIKNLVLGVEGDFSWTDASGSVTLASPLIAGVTSTATARYSSYATIAGRAGYAWDSWLVYVKGGGAFARVEYGGRTFIPAQPLLVPNPISSTLSGWTVGVGLEYGFLKNWSAKAEYDYLDFGTTQRVFITAGAPGPATNIDTHVHMVKFGLNYHLNGR